MMLTLMANKPEERYSATILSRELDIPLQYCRQILTDLSKKNLIKSTHGRTGGFVFARPVDEIYMLEVVEALNGLENFNRCVMGFVTCPLKQRNQCVLHKPWETSRKLYMDALKNTSLNHFLGVNKAAV